LSVYVFLAHLSHDASPSSLLAVPAGHLIHVPVSDFPSNFDPYVPDGHFLHFSCPVRSFYVPSLHLWHISSPSSDAYFPLGHSWGAGVPGKGHIWPLGHPWQSSFLSDPVDGI